MTTSHSTSKQTLCPVLIAGEWRGGSSAACFSAVNPATAQPLPGSYPVSSAADINNAVHAGHQAAQALRDAKPAAIATFLESFAAAIESHADELVEIAHLETALPKTPRLRNVELPRTVDQLRQAARASREGSWRRPIRDEAKKIYSTFAPLGGPVVVMGPNNFPFAFNSVSGGDFAAAIAAQNPVIAKANPAHPGTTRRLAELAHHAVLSANLPPATVQMIYHLEASAGLELVANPLVGATAFTGSRRAGLALKAAADRAAKLIYLEMGSVNPVILLPGALRERGEAIVDEFCASSMMGAGQFCTNPGLIILPDDDAGKSFVELAKQKFESSPPGVLFSRGGVDGLSNAVQALRRHGARVLCGGSAVPGPAFRYANTLLQVSGDDFLKCPVELQTEAFGAVSLLVMSRDRAQRVAIIQALEGNLTGTIYSDSGGSDDADYAAIEPVLRQRVGRLMNDRMPTGVAVSAAMNHGGPFPASGHPGFTAVGLPTSIQRFAALHCYDNVRPDRLPESLR